MESNTSFRFLRWLLLAIAVCVGGIQGLAQTKTAQSKPTAKEQVLKAAPTQQGLDQRSQHRHAHAADDERATPRRRRAYQSSPRKSGRSEKTEHNFPEWGAAMKTRILCDPAAVAHRHIGCRQTTIPTCNSFDATGVVPIFSTATPPDATGTTLCTDYFGKANYANSPLPIGGVDISADWFHDSGWRQWLHRSCRYHYRLLQHAGRKRCCRHGHARPIDGIDPFRQRCFGGQRIRCSHRNHHRSHRGRRHHSCQTRSGHRRGWNRYPQVCSHRRASQLAPRRSGCKHVPRVRLLRDRTG